MFKSGRLAGAGGSDLRWMNTLLLLCVYEIGGGNVYAPRFHNGLEEA